MMRRTTVEKKGLQCKVQDFNFKPKKMEGEVNEKVEKEVEEKADNEEEIANLLLKESYSTEVSKIYEKYQIHPKKEKWNSAMKEEMKTMSNRGVWDLVDPLKDAKIISSK